ncbi:MAG: hypothetical protein QM534_14850 [Sediminibacterium sp.]|nr:hypothetical protein [Sediminibacterium sp.]
MFKHFLLLLLLSGSLVQAQSRKKSDTAQKGHYGPFLCIVDYTHQKASTLGYSIGIFRMFKRHTYIAVAPGANLLRLNNTTYLQPTGIFEFSYQPKFWRGSVSPSLRGGFVSFKVMQQRDNYLFGDIGLRIFGPTLYVGYNVNLDTKDLNEVSGLRLGIRIP